MDYLFIISILAMLGLIYMRFEAGYLKVERVKLTNNKKALKIIQISDVHINYLKVRPEKVKKVITAEKPDVVILSGDYIQTPRDITNFLHFLDHIVGICPVYLCFGNHDHHAYEHNPEGINDFANMILKKGIHILQNRCIQVTKNGKVYDLAGLGDLRYNMNNFFEAAAGFSPKAFARIAFSHNPDLVLSLPKGAFDYMFCGHFHGGQIWAPFGLEFKLLRSDYLCKKGIYKGLHKVNGINLYINRGLGNVLFPLRFLSRPEITIAYIP